MAEPERRAGLAAARWPRHTARLLLRPATVDDATPTFAYRRLPEVSEHLPRQQADRAAYTESFVLPDRLEHTLVIEHDGAIVGDLMLRIGDGWAQSEVHDRAVASEAELGWVLAPWATGHGFAREAVIELIRVAFTDLGLRRVTAICFADNEASWRLMEAVGMRLESQARGDALHRSGQWLDSRGYALLREEWAPAHATDAIGAPDLRAPAGSADTSS